MPCEPGQFSTIKFIPQVHYNAQILILPSVPDINYKQASQVIKIIGFTELLRNQLLFEIPLLRGLLQYNNSYQHQNLALSD